MRMFLIITHRLERSMVEQLAKLIDQDLSGPLGVYDVRVEENGNISFECPTFPREDSLVMRWLTSLFEGSGFELEVPDSPGQPFSCIFP